MRGGGEARIPEAQSPAPPPSAASPAIGISGGSTPPGSRDILPLMAKPNLVELFVHMPAKHNCFWFFGSVP